MVTVDSPLSYLLKISIFCSRVIDLAFFLPGASFSPWSCFGAMLHKRSLHKKALNHCTNTKEDDRQNTNNAQYVQEHKRTRLRGTNNSGRRDAESDPSSALVTPLPPPTSVSLLRRSVPPTSRCTQIRTFGFVVIVGLTRLRSDFRSRLSWFCVDFHRRAPKNCVGYI